MYKNSKYVYCNVSFPMIHSNYHLIDRFVFNMYFTNINCYVRWTFC